jgi:hypothetical protein
MMNNLQASSKMMLRSVVRKAVRRPRNNAAVVSWTQHRLVPSLSQGCNSFTGTATRPLSEVRSFSAATTVETPKRDKTKDKTNNLFLDNLGTIFLSAIGMVVAWLMRSYYNTKGRNLLRDAVERNSAVDPIELDDLRVANSELTVQVFSDIQQHVLATCEDSLTYPDFVEAVRTAMMRLNGDAFTIQLGHLLDRVAVAAVLKRKEDNSELVLSTKLPVQFWLTVLSLALAGTPTDRIHVLYDILLKNDTNSNKVSIDQVTELVGYLQDSCQLTPDAQIVATVNKYPLQEYVVGTPSQLVDRHHWEETQEQKEGDDKKSTTTSTDPCNNIDVDTFAAILRSKSVCVWGECYHRKKFG